MIFKQIPTMISDLNKLGIALKSLDAMKIGTVGVNIANVEAYRTALKGLSVEQSVFALASKGATEEQIRQILIINEATAKDVEAAIAKAGLTTATKALTQAEMIEIATKNGVAKVEAEELLRKIGITATEEGQVAVKNQVTLAMLEQAVASGNLTAAESTQIATMLGLNAVETTNIGITNVLTASFAKLWAVITAHPIGAILTAIGAVAVGTIAYINKTNKDAKKALVEAHETAQQALEDTKTSLSDDKSELQSVNSELETTKQKIQEISSIGAPTLVEQNELNKLSTSNAQLEIQRTLLENNIKLKQKSAALDAKELLGTQVEMEYADILDGSSIESHNESYSYKDHAKYQASNLKNAYNIYMKALREGDVKKQQLAQELIAASAGDSATLTSELLEIIESFKYEDRTVIEGYEKIYNEYMGLIYNLQSLTNPETFLDIAKSVTSNTGIDYEKVISDAYKLAFEGNFDIDKLNQDFVKALSDAGIDESTIDYIFSVKQQEYQLLVDKINEKYKVSETPDKIRQDYWDANGNIHSEYIDVDEETKKQIAEINTVNERLNEYAKENPIEFQLVSSFDEDFETLDKYIEEERIKAENTTDYVGDYVTNAIKHICDEAKVQSSTFNIENPISTFEDAWAESFTSENDKVKGLGDTLLDLAEKGRLTTEAFDQADTEAGDYFKSLDISAEEAVSKINKLVDESNQLSSMSSQISKISEVLGTKRDDKFVSADTLSGFDTEIRGLDSWDRFQEVLGSTASSYQECQEAANALATEWVNSSDFLAQLTEQNEEYYATQLKAMGIENYEEIIAYAQELNSAKDSLSQASFDLATATAQEVQELINEGEYSALAQQQIWNLALAKQAASSDSLNTADDCQRLLYLAQNAGVTGTAISLLTELMGIYNNLSHGIYGTNADVLNEITTRAESIKQNILNLLSNYSSDTVEPKPRIKLSPRAKETAGSAGSFAAEAFTEALDKELAALDKNLNAGYIVFNDYIQARLALIEDYYNQGKLSADEYYSYLEKHYDTQLSYMDQVVNAVTRRIDTKLDALKQQKENVENIYKVQIDSLEKQKTLLEEANQERQRQKDLQKSLYDMEQARNQRTQMVYTEGRGMHYAADDQAIREAQENVDNARYDMQIAEIEKSVSELEAARDRETGIIDEKISDLEAYRDAWSDVTSAYTEEQENLIAAQILGADWETDILNGRLGILDAFKNQYISIQQAMADAAWQSANEQMKAAKEAEKGASGSQSDTPKIGSNKKTPPADDDPQTSGTSGRGSGNSYALLVGNRITSKLNLKAYASGTQHAEKGLNLVGEDGAEAYFDNHGHVAIVTEPTLIPMEGGEVVKNERDTKMLLDPDNLVPADAIGFDNTAGREIEHLRKLNAETITLSDGTVLTPVQPGGKMYDMMRRFNTYWGNKNADKFAPDFMFEHNKQMLETGNQITGNNSMVNHNRNMQPVITQNITLTCPNVTNNSGVEYIQKELGHLSQMALQESMKR